MAIEDIWLCNLKALVTKEGGGRRGLRAVADSAGLSEEYVYQLVEGKPKKDGTPRGVGKTAATKIARAFADGGPEGWFDTAEFEQTATPANEPSRSSLKAGGVDLDAALQVLSSHLAGVSEKRRATVVGLLTDLVHSPDDGQILDFLKTMLDSKAFVETKRYKS